MNEHIKVLSIKRIYAERIFTGEKTIELRKRDIGIHPGMLILLYEIAPDSCIRGGFISHRTMCLPKGTMWQQHHKVLGIDRESYDTYLAETEMVFGTHIWSATKFEPVEFDKLVNSYPGFVPPQSTLNWRADWAAPNEWLEFLSQERQKLLDRGAISEQLCLFREEL